MLYLEGLMSMVRSTVVCAECRYINLLFSVLLHLAGAVSGIDGVGELAAGYTVPTAHR